MTLQQYNMSVGQIFKATRQKFCSLPADLLSDCQTGFAVTAITTSECSLLLKWASTGLYFLSAFLESHWLHFLQPACISDTFAAPNDVRTYPNAISN